MRNITIPTLFVLGTIFIGLSIFGGWSLVQTMNDMMDYHSSIMFLSPGEPLPPPPPDRFFGTEAIGWMFPTVSAILGTLAFSKAYRLLMDICPKDQVARIRLPRFGFSFWRRHAAKSHPTFA